jgi:TetR/AcrR family transcriptional regulator, ethionamide resistance regulator
VSASTATRDPKPARGRRTPRVSGDERERAILETAEKLLAERPLHEISVDDLARGAGISRPTFYFYFPSKEAVLLSLLDRLVEEARSGSVRAIERLPEDPPARLREGIEGVYKTFNAHRAVALAATDASVTSDDVRELWSRVMGQFVEETTAAIEALRAQGVAPPGIPARDLATALNLMNERAMLATFAQGSPAIDEERLIDTLVSVWLGAVYGAGAGPPAHAG